MPKPSSLRLLALLTLGACLQPSQRAEDLFADRQTMPPAFDKLANPPVPPNALARPTANSVAVAVIDNGVDYLHPSLRGRLRHVPRGPQNHPSLGWDFQGADAFPHPSLISPSFLAFGAKKIEDGRIVGASEDGLALFLDFNRSFLTRLQSRIRADRRLAKTPFATKLGSRSLTLPAVDYILEDGFFDPKRYETNRQAGLLMMGSKLSLALREEVGDEAAAALEAPQWEMASEISESHHLSYLAYVDGADAFLDLVRQTLKEWESESGYRAAYRTFVDYDIKDARNGDDATPGAKLHGAWYAQAHDFPDHFPERTLAQLFCHQLKPRERMEWARLAPAARSARAERLVADHFKSARRYLELVASQGRSTSQRTGAKNSLAVLPEAEKLAREALRSTNVGALLACGDPARVRISDPARVRDARKRFHPYLDPGSSEEVHGTHVAGIVARQSPHVDIIPIRVTTSGTAVVEKRAKQLVDNSVQIFDRWMRHPAVAKTLREKFPGLGSGSGAVAKVRQYLEENLDDLYLNLVFFEDIRGAIRLVGANRVLVANMSLGVESDTVPVSQPVGRGGDENLGFLFTESLKFAVAETVLEHAPHTLFVVAAGNSKTWLDGRTRSGLPCDLRSPLFASEGVEALPNNRLNNVLCVGSLKQMGQLSEFTNIVLGETPFVLSYGEEVLAPVKLTSCEGIQQRLLEEDLKGIKPSIPSPVALKNGISIDELAAKLPPFPEALSMVVPDLKLELWVRWMNTLLTSTQSTLAVSRCARESSPKARLSGTSMASPAVAGFVARFMAARLRASHLSEDHAYGHPDFLPAKIIADLYARSPEYGGASLIREIPQVLKIRAWDRATPEQRQKLRRVPVLSARDSLDGGGI